MNGRPLSFGGYLAGAGLVIAVLFTVLDPSSSRGLGPLARLLYWTLHAYGALAGLTLAQALVSRLGSWRRAGPWRRPWLAIVAAGVLGAWFFAPLALGLENLLGLAPESDGDALDDWAARWGPLGALLVEALELTAPVATTWLALNIPWLLRLDFRAAPSQQSVRLPIPAARSSPETEVQAMEANPPGSDAPAEVESPREQRPEKPPPGQSTATEDESAESVEAAADAQRVETAAKTDIDVETAGGPLAMRPEGGLVDQLPAALGRDLVALSSQLHYLAVQTSRGRMLVLYNLRDAVRELQGSIDGMQIHRSHWVADAHIRRLVKRGSGWVCELSTGLELPVSRRRVAEAKKRWGAGAAYRHEAA